MRYGYVIRIGGDPEISGALEAGLRAATPQRRAGEDAIRRVAMMRHTPEEWQAMIAKAQYDYGQDRPAPRWARGLLGVWGLVCCGMSRLYHAQEIVTERRGA